MKKTKMMSLSIVGILHHLTGFILSAGFENILNKNFFLLILAGALIMT